MKRVLYILLGVVVVATSLTGCQDWLDINTSKDAPVTVTCEEVLPSLLFFATQGVYDFAEYGTYMSQCLTTGGKAQTSSLPYKNGWGGFMEMNRHPQWRRHYYDVGVNAQYLIADAEAKGARNYILVTRTLLLNSLMLTTDMFGEMPRSEAYKSNNPPYDTQEEIYAYLEQEFQDLLKLYDDPEWTECPTNTTMNDKRDRMFAGDLNKWRAFTKALYCRLLVRQIPNWNNTPATCDRIINAVDEVLAIWGDDASYEPLYKFSGGSAEQNCQWGPSKPKMNLGWAQARANDLEQAIPSAFFGALLGFYPNKTYLANSVKYNGKRITTDKADVFALDPRADRMMHHRKNGKETPLLQGCLNNIGLGTSDKVTYYPDLYCTTLNDSTMNNYKSNPYTRDDGYVAFITKEELLFIKAEAQYWNNDRLGAYATTKEAVECSFRRYTVYGNLGEEKNINEEGFINFFYKYRLPADHFTIANLMQQKYVALYLQPEQWCDVRRYNYSSATNGIQYDGEYVYSIEYVHDASEGTVKEKNFIKDNVFDLTRPYNIYEAQWMTDKDKGTQFKLTANAWVNRISADPETEEKYNKAELERIGAYKNPDWMRKRMVWQRDINSNGAITNKGEGTWM